MENVPRYVETPQALEQRKRLEIEFQARALIAAAREAGYNVEISPRPLQPLAMRNFELAVSVWPFRE